MIQFAKYFNWMRCLVDNGSDQDFTFAGIEQYPD